MALVANTSNKPKVDRDLVSRVKECMDKGMSEDQIRAMLAEELNLEPINAGIIKTRQGALMVRVSDSRWPIAMYKKDWRILLAKIPAIERALEELDIAEENPNPAASREARKVTTVETKAA